MKNISLLLLVVGVLLIISHKVEPLNNTYTRNNNYSYKGENIWIIDIPKIKLEHVTTLSSIYSKKINGVILFKEYGRPDIQKSNTVIGAHSGTGPIAFFNNIDELYTNDEINLYYNFKNYKYRVIYKYKVKETDLSPLNNNTNKTILTLMTCDKYNFKERLIVVAEMV